MKNQNTKGLESNHYSKTFSDGGVDKEHSKKSTDHQGLMMETNWVILGWLIDMTLNGFVWLIIAAFSLLLIDVTDTWTRKVIKWMDKADNWIRKLIDNLFKWIQTKNLKLLSSIILLIIFGILAQLEVIPKLIT